MLSHRDPKDASVAETEIEYEKYPFVEETKCEKDSNPPMMAYNVT